MIKTIARAALAIMVCLAVAPASAESVFTVSGPITLVPLDVATVTTGGTAVTALAAAHRNKGGWLFNPNTATVNLCINEIGTASGTTSAGNTTCIIPGQTYVLAASPNAVSVISSDSAHPFSGYGWN
jgi:inosine-uridine nucleoside N-ribohydrolase